VFPVVETYAERLFEQKPESNLPRRGVKLAGVKTASSSSRQYANGMVLLDKKSENEVPRISFMKY
jgi:hypothetical protein